MGKIIAIAAQKGGTGKTTTGINLAAAFSAMKRKVLLIDFDPQGNASTGCGIAKENIIFTSGQVLMGITPIESALIRSESAQFDLLPTGEDLIAAEMLLLEEAERKQRLQSILKPIHHQYDYIFIDCPPSLSMLTINALVAADSVLIPMQCEYFALEGLKALLNAIERIRSTIHSGLHIEGILRTMYDGRNRLTQDVSKQLLAHFKEQVYHTVIPRNVRLAEAPSYGLSILHYDHKSPGAIAYLALAGEMLRRSEEKQNKVVADVADSSVPIA